MADGRNSIDECTPAAWDRLVGWGESPTVTVNDTEEDHRRSFRQTRKAQEAVKRKREPLATGLLDYFPDALKAVANCSLVGNEQHNPGQPLHWARDKSADHADCLMRHLSERGTVDDDGILHDVKVAWRSLALLQVKIEGDRNGG